MQIWSIIQNNLLDSWVVGTVDNVVLGVVVGGYVLASERQHDWEMDHYKSLKRI